MDIKCGDTFHRKGREYKYHIVKILNQEEEPQIVYKYYGKHKQWWHYEVESIFGFNDAVDIGLYTMDKVIAG